MAINNNIEHINKREAIKPVIADNIKELIATVNANTRSFFSKFLLTISIVGILFLILESADKSHALKSLADTVKKVKTEDSTSAEMKATYELGIKTLEINKITPWSISPEEKRYSTLARSPKTRSKKLIELCFTTAETRAKAGNYLELAREYIPKNAEDISIDQNKEEHNGLEIEVAQKLYEKLLFIQKNFPDVNLKALCSEIETEIKDNILKNELLLTEKPFKEQLRKELKTIFEEEYINAFNVEILPIYLDLLLLLKDKDDILITLLPTTLKEGLPHKHKISPEKIKKVRDLLNKLGEENAIQRIKTSIPYMKPSPYSDLIYCRVTLIKQFYDNPQYDFSDKDEIFKFANEISANDDFDMALKLANAIAKHTRPVDKTLADHFSNYLTLHAGEIEKAKAAQLEVPSLMKYIENCLVERLAENKDDPDEKDTIKIAWRLEGPKDSQDDFNRLKENVKDLLKGADFKSFKQAFENWESSADKPFGKEFLDEWMLNTHSDKNRIFEIALKIGCREYNLKETLALIEGFFALDKDSFNKDYEAWQQKVRNTNQSFSPDEFIRSCNIKYTKDIKLKAIANIEKENRSPDFEKTLVNSICAVFTDEELNSPQFQTSSLPIYLGLARALSIKENSDFLNEHSDLIKTPHLKIGIDKEKVVKLAKIISDNELVLKNEQTIRHALKTTERDKNKPTLVMEATCKRLFSYGDEPFSLGELLIWMFQTSYSLIQKDPYKNFAKKEELFGITMDLAMISSPSIEKVAAHFIEGLPLVYNLMKHDYTSFKKIYEEWRLQPNSSGIEFLKSYYP